MKPFVKWGLTGLVGLVLLGALFGKGGKSDQSKKVVATPSTASTTDTTTTAASTPEPTPDPEVSVNFTGPVNVYSDNVVLKGTVHPANAHVRVRGHSVEVRHGRWTLPVTL